MASILGKFAQGKKQHTEEETAAARDNMCRERNLHKQQTENRRVAMPGKAAQVGGWYDDGASGGNSAGL